MRNCRVCGAVYDDPNMRFCLTDGTQLELMTPLEDMETAVYPSTSPIAEAAPTVQMHGEFQTRPTSIAPPTTKKRGLSAIAKFAIAIVLLGVVAIGLAAVAGGIYLATLDRKPRVNAEPTEPTSPSAQDRRSESVPSNELEKRISELENELEDARSPSMPHIPSLDVLQGMEDSAVAKVNSPKDGFLALRSLPGVEQGERIAKIPNGETVVIYGCAGETTVDGKAGKWCRAIYNAKFGWVFDAFVVRLGSAN